MKKSIFLFSFLCAFCFVHAGCAVVLAMRQPDKKNLQVLSNGTARDNVIGYLGTPIASQVKAGRREDIYHFRQGFNGATKASRALFHGVADVFTIGLWEAVGTPTELIWKGDEMTVKVTYDEKNRVENVVYLGKI